MPQRASSQEWTLPVLLWAFLGACISTGCSYDDPQYEVDLPNGYTLTEWSWGEVTITNPDGEPIGEPYFTINQVAVSGDLVYGNYIYKDDEDQSVQEHFIIETAAGSYRWFIEYADWQSALEADGVEEKTLQCPSALRTRLPSRIVLFISVATLCALLLTLYWITRSLMSFETQLRQQRLERQ